MRSSEWKRGVQRIGLITLNSPDLGNIEVKIRYLYCPDKSIVFFWDVLSIAHAYKTYAKCDTGPILVPRAHDPSGLRQESRAGRSGDTAAK